MNASVYGSLKLDDDQPNRPPKVIDTIFRVELINGFPKTAVSNLGSVFSDPDGDQLFYYAVSDNPMLEVEIQNDTSIVVGGPNCFGSAMVTVTASDGDLSVNTQFTVDCAIDNINNLQPEGLLDIWPNPAQSAVNIRISNNVSGLVDFQVTDLSGKLIIKQFRFKINFTEEYVIDLNDLDPGIYILLVSQGAYSTTKKIIHQ
jgi:hypothetical protein